MFLQLAAGNLHPRGWDKDLLVKLPVDRKSSCSVIPRKLSCHLPLSGGDKESDSSDKRGFNRQTLVCAALQD